MNPTSTKPQARQTRVKMYYMRVDEFKDWAAARKWALISSVVEGSGEDECTMTFVTPSGAVVFVLTQLVQLRINGKRRSSVMVKFVQNRGVMSIPEFAV